MVEIHTLQNSLPSSFPAKLPKYPVGSNIYSLWYGQCVSYKLFLKNFSNYLTFDTAKTPRRLESEAATSVRTCNVACV